MIRILIAFLLLGVPLRAVTPELFLDLNRTGSGSSSQPKELVAIESTLFFVSDDGLNGREIWKSNGTPATTVLAADTVPGPGGSSPRRLKAIDRSLYFVATIQGQNQILKASYPQMTIQKLAGIPRAYEIRDYAVVGARTFFSRCGRTSGCQLWITDTPGAPPRLVKDIRKVSYSSINYLTPLNGRVIFSADDSLHGSEIWSSDGTAGGTILLQDIARGPDSSYPSYLTLFANHVIFNANDRDQYGSEIYKTDGTPAGTSLVADLSPGPDSGYPARFVPFRNQVVFSADSRLYAMDGALRPREIPGDYPSSPQNITVTDKLVFFVSDTQLWVSDLSQTRYVNYDPYAEFAVILGAFQGKVLYCSGPILKITDGTQAGTKTIGPFEVDVEETASTSNRVYFTAGRHIIELDLFASDGALSGPVNLGKTRIDNGSSNPDGLRSCGGFLYFTASEQEYDYALWRTAGGSAAQKVMGGGYSLCSGNTLYVKSGDQLYRILKGGKPQNITPPGGTVGYEIRLLNRKVLFWQPDTAREGIQLWSTDGTPAGSRLLKTVGANVQYASLRFRANAGNLVYFVVSGAYSSEVWRTDGTSAGTILLAATPYDPTHFFAANSRMYFLLRVPFDHSEVWSSDGTAVGTRKISDIGEVQDAAMIFPNLFFTSRSQLWKVSLPVGTSTLVTPLSDAFANIFPQGRHLLYMNRRAIWRTDGSGAGVPLKAANDAYPAFAAGNLHYFTAHTDAAGLELWVTDGTPNGTRRVFDLYPGPYDSAPSGFVTFQGELYFAGAAPRIGRELFRLQLPARE